MVAGFLKADGKIRASISILARRYHSLRRQHTWAGHVRQTAERAGLMLLFLRCGRAL